MRVSHTPVILLKVQKRRANKMCGRDHAGGCDYHGYGAMASQPMAYAPSAVTAMDMAQQYDSRTISAQPLYAPTSIPPAPSTHTMGGAQPPAYLVALGEAARTMQMASDEAIGHLERDIVDEGVVTVRYEEDAPSTIDDLIAAHI